MRELERRRRKRELRGVIEAGATDLDFLMAGTFVQTVAFGADDRCRPRLGPSPARARRPVPLATHTGSAVLTGRTVADLVRNTFVVLVMLAVGLLVGYRPEAGVAGWMIAIGLLLFSFVFYPTVGARAAGAQPRLRALPS